MRSAKHQQGITLTELLIGLGIALGVLIIMFIVYLAVSQQRDAVQIEQAVAAVAVAVRQTAGGSVFVGIDNTLVKRTGRIPRAYDGAGDHITGSWGGSITVEPRAGGAAFAIIADTISRSACNTVVAGTHHQFLTVEIGSTLVKDHATALVPSATDIANACDNERNTITWTATGA